MRILGSIFSFKATDSIAAVGSATVSTLFSPSWWLTKNLLSPYLNLDELLAQGIAPDTLLNASIQLHELGSEVLTQQVMPILLLCIAASLSYLFISCWLGKKAFRLILNQIQAKASA
jgi:hypothetical protein